VIQFQTRLTMTVLAGALALSAGTAHADECGAAIAKAMGGCVKKVGLQFGKCLKKTGDICATDASFVIIDEKITSTLSKMKDQVTKGCPNDAALNAAGYTGLAFEVKNHLGDICLTQGQNIADRTFGRDGSRYDAASDDDKKCLQSAAKSAAKLISKSLGTISKCLDEGCTFDFSEAVTKEVTTVTKKCPTLQALTGATPQEFVDASESQILDAVKAPCDPMDTTRCIFPFPSDYFTQGGAGTPTGRRISFAARAIKADGNGTPISPKRWNEADGWSIGPMLLFQDTNIDLTQTGATPITDLAHSLTPTAPVVIIDAETLEQQLLWVERDLRGATTADQPLIIRVGKNLKENHRYIVALRNMKDSGGAALPAPAAFAIYRDDTPSTLLPIEARRQQMEDIFSILTSAGVARNELYMAWDFTTQSTDSVAGRLLAMRDDAFDTLGVAAPAFTVDLVTDNPATGILKYVDGTFQVPSYLVPQTPQEIEDEEAQRRLRTDINYDPYTDGDFYTANYRCVIPESATTGGSSPAIPAKLSLYGHGLLGAHTEVSASNVRAMANEHNFIFCATDWTGFASDDVLVAAKVLANFSVFPDFIDKQHQGMLNMMFLGRLMKHANGFTSHTAFQVDGESMLDTSNLFYDGNSQGGILGGVLAAFLQDGSRMVLGVPGMNYSTLLNRSVDFDEYDAFFQMNYAQSTDRQMLLSLSQLIWDRTDANGHILHTTSNPYVGTPAKSLLYHVAFGDHQVAPVTAEIAARSNGTPIHTPTLVPGKVVPEVTPYYDIDPIPSYPHAGSALVIWDSGNPAPPTGNVPPASIDPVMAGLEACTNDTNGDPHSCPRSDPDARVQKAAFLDAAGEVIDVCGGLACEAQ
jgi:hypothetical protein